MVTPETAPLAVSPHTPHGRTASQSTFTAHGASLSGHLPWSSASLPTETVGGGGMTLLSGSRVGRLPLALSSSLWPDPHLGQCSFPSRHFCGQTLPGVQAQRGAKCQHPFRAHSRGTVAGPPGPPSRESGQTHLTVRCARRPWNWPHPSDPQSSGRKSGAENLG